MVLKSSLSGPDVRVPAEESTANAGAAETFPVIEEFATVEKVQVDTGGYRISKKVTVNETIVDELLRNRRVVVERRPVGVRVFENDMPHPRQEGDTFIVPVIEEVLVTERRLMLVEEVRVTTVEGTHRSPHIVDLRKEEVLVERLPADPVAKFPRNTA